MVSQPMWLYLLVYFIGLVLGAYILMVGPWTGLSNLEFPTLAR